LDHRFRFFLTCHKFFKIANLYRRNENILPPNGKIVSSTILGVFIGYLNSNKIYINNVCYVPHIRKNIISVNQLIKEHYKIIFFNHGNNSYVSLYDRFKNKIITSKSDSHNTFTFKLSSRPINFNKTQNPASIFNLSTLSKTNKINLWHRRLGHFNINQLKNKLLQINIKTKCPICFSSKLTNLNYKKSDNKTKSTFELIVKENTKIDYNNKRIQ